MDRNPSPYAFEPTLFILVQHGVQQDLRSFGTAQRAWARSFQDLSGIGKEGRTSPRVRRTRRDSERVHICSVQKSWPCRIGRPYEPWRHADDQLNRSIVADRKQIRLTSHSLLQDQFVLFPLRYFGQRSPNRTDCSLCKVDRVAAVQDVLPRLAVRRCSVPQRRVE